MGPDPTRLCVIVFQFDNARPHCAAAVKEFLEKISSTAIWQTPYSPDLNLCGRWTFNHIKRILLAPPTNVENIAEVHFRSLPTP